jgi:TolA-binding protein
MRQAVLAAALAAAASSSFAQGLFDDNEARRRVELLRQSIETNQRAMDERLTKIEGTVANSSDRSAMVELSGQLEALRGEISRMRGQIEVLANQVDTADKRQKDLYLDIDTRLRKLEQSREQQAAAADKPAVAEAEASPAETRAYQAARQLRARGIGDAGVHGDLPAKQPGAERPVLGRHGAFRPARLQKRDRGAEEAARRLA